MHQLKVADPVFLLPKDGRQHFAGRVINGGQQVQPRSALFQPVVGTAINLHQHPLLGVASAAAMLRSLAFLRLSGHQWLHDAPHTGSGDHDAVPFFQEVPQMLVVRSGIRALRQNDDPPARGFVNAMAGPTSAIAMNHGGDPLLPIGRQKSLHLPL